MFPGAVTLTKALSAHNTMFYPNGKSKTVTVMYNNYSVN